MRRSLAGDCQMGERCCSLGREGPPLKVLLLLVGISKGVHQ